MISREWISSTGMISKKPVFDITLPCVNRLSAVRVISLYLFEPVVSSKGDITYTGKVISSYDQQVISLEFEFSIFIYGGDTRCMNTRFH